MAANVDDTVVTGVRKRTYKIAASERKEKYHRGVYLRLFEREGGKESVFLEAGRIGAQAKLSSARIVVVPSS